MNKNDLKQYQLLDMDWQKYVDQDNPATADEDNECRK
jgi:hypothetical protein